MLDVRPIPAFRDNYIWLIHGAVDPRIVAVVDPGDARPVMATLKSEGLKLGAILATHHHADHVGGVAALAAESDAQVFGPARERMPVEVTRVSQLSEWQRDFRRFDAQQQALLQPATAGNGDGKPHG